MGRNPCCSKEGLNRGAWTAMEDKILREYIKVHGEGKWRNLPKRAGLKRCGKSCRLRWLNYLRPDIKRGNISHDEEELIIRLHNLLGNRWSLIAGRLPGRTDNEIKNYWNTNIGKKIQSGQPASTSNTTCRTKPPSNQPKLPPPSPNKTTLSNAQQPSETSPNPSVVRTKASRCTKVILPPHHDPQNNDHENGYKPALDTEVNDELVNDQIVVAGAVGPGDHDQPLIPFVPDDDDHHESNNSQYFMQADPDHHDFGMDEKFLSDFLNIDCLEMEFSDCFGMNGGRNDHESGIEFNIMTSPCSVDNVDPKGGSDDQNVLFSDQDMIEFLQSGSTSHDHLIDSNEMDWFQD